MSNTDMFDGAIKPMKAIRKVLKEHGYVTMYNNKYKRSRTLKVYSSNNDKKAVSALMDLMDDESRVEKLGRYSSMSVGDILELNDGSRYVVASFGFKPL